MIYPRISALATLLAGGALLVEANPIERRDPCVVTDISQVAGAKGCQTYVPPFSNRTHALSSPSYLLLAPLSFLG